MNWISVKDELPEDCQNILFFTGKKCSIDLLRFTTLSGYYCKEDEEFTTFIDGITFEKKDIACWIPLPEDPTED